MGMLVTAMVLLWLVWGWWTGCEVNAQLDEIRRRGEPVETSDVVYKFVPDSQNAWLLQAQASGALVSGVDLWIK